MTVGKLFDIFKQHDIPNDAVLMSDSRWECSATDMDGIYYNKSKNIVVFTQSISDHDGYHNQDDWIACKGVVDKVRDQVFHGCADEPVLNDGILGRVDA